MRLRKGMRRVLHRCKFDDLQRLTSATFFVSFQLWLTFGLPCTPAEGEPEITLCESHARKHFGGPGGCWKPPTTAYWQRVSECLKPKPLIEP